MNRTMNKPNRRLTYPDSRAGRCPLGNRDLQEHGIGSNGGVPNRRRGHTSRYDRFGLEAEKAVSFRGFEYKN
jgi:hypothetical protein